MSATPCNVLLVFPRFEFPSFWNCHATCWIAGKRHAAPPLGLITVAALLPSAWQSRLIDQNLQRVSEGDLAWADLVLTGGMISQRPDTLRVIELCRSIGKPVVAGGPDVTSSPQLYGAADFKILGEAELVMEAFVAAWDSGARQGVFEAEKYQADMTKSPVPRFELLKRNDYLHLSVQFSRGCPFTCEFCDIIELYGRVPRAKNPQQVLAELDALYDSGYRGNIDFVDDNLIGNKKAVKAFLPHLIAWQRARGYPFAFTTQASVNLADDADLLQLMRDANFFAVFIGIESPNADTLISTRKKQNIHRDIADCVHKIHGAGMFVVGGFIIGFDCEKHGVAEEIVACIEESAIPICTISELTALPNTQLWRRLRSEGRLPDQADIHVDGTIAGPGGLNFATLRPRRDVLVDYRTVLQKVYSPEAFFARLKVVGRTLARAKLRKRIPLGVHLHNVATLARMVWWIARHECGSRLRFARAFVDCARHNPRALEDVVSLMMIYLHAGPYSRSVIDVVDQQIASIEEIGDSRSDPVSSTAQRRPVDEVRSVDRRVGAGARQRHRTVLRDRDDMAQTSNVLLVYPRFDNPSFWQFTAACEVSNRRCLCPPLGLITVAALLPPDWPVRLVDRNAEELSDDDLAWADLVMTGGMLPQQPDTLRVIDICKRRGTPVVVGGPDATTSPHVYADADFRVLGEAEDLIDEFASAWRAGVRGGDFEAEKFKTDVTTSPTPRYDLLRLDLYVDMNVQFSRGCPFTCEFCDIIELYGRVPRTKTAAQVLAELDALYRRGYRGNVLLVDDNLIGNKKAVKAFLPHLVDWQRRHGYPFTLSTQASINLADEDALLALMRDANFRLVFIGIETPNEGALIAAGKKQNARRNVTRCVRRIYQAGMMVAAGFILGFDGEPDGIAEEMIACIEEAQIPLCMVGLLTALPNTRLARRLASEGRLMAGTDLSRFEGGAGGDQCTAGVNFTPARSRRAILSDYRLVLQRIYEPAAYLARVQATGRLLARPKLRVRIEPSVVARDIRTLGRLIWRLTRRHPHLLGPFWRTFFDCALRNPAVLHQVVTQMVIYLHVGPFSRFVIEQIDRQLTEMEVRGDGSPLPGPMAATRNPVAARP